MLGVLLMHRPASGPMPTATRRWRSVECGEWKKLALITSSASVSCPGIRFASVEGDEQDAAAQAGNRGRRGGTSKRTRRATESPRQTSVGGANRERASEGPP